MGKGQWYRWSRKSNTDDYPRLTISQLVKGGGIQSMVIRWMEDRECVLRVRITANALDREYPFIRLCYGVDDIEYDHTVRLNTTRPHYGGVRWWFICPAKGCGRRVATLYAASKFACRHCYRLSYPSQNQPTRERMDERALKIAQQLGLEGDMTIGFYGAKPKGMHRRTFTRKLRELAAHGSPMVLF